MIQEGVKPWDAERYTPGEARLYLEGIGEKWNRVDEMLMLIVKAANPQFAEKILEQIDLEKRRPKD